MKTMKTMLACLAGLTVVAGLAAAQDGGGRSREGRGPRPDGDRGPAEARGGGEGGGQGGGQPMHRPPQGMKPPLFAALDKNDDGKIDERELEHAAAALKTLDKNGDGAIDLREIMPPRPMGPPPGDEVGERGRRGPGEGGGDRPGRGQDGERRGGREGGDRRGPPPPDQQ